MNAEASKHTTSFLKRASANVVATPHRSNSNGNRCLPSAVRYSNDFLTTDKMHLRFPSPEMKATLQEWVDQQPEGLAALKFRMLIAPSRDCKGGVQIVRVSDKSMLTHVYVMKNGPFAGHVVTPDGVVMPTAGEYVECGGDTDYERATWMG